MKYFFVVPYRNRPNCLTIFGERFPAFVRAQPDIQEFTILIVEQEQGKQFNLGKTINVGYDLVKKRFGLGPDDRFIFHPVDCIPIEGRFEVPVGGATVFCDNDPQTGKRDGGIWGKAHGFEATTFEKVNGYSNEYWGWGCEDNDLFIRLDIHAIPIMLSYMTYDILMGHGDDHTPDIDESDVQTVNYLANKKKLDVMIAERNETKSGLNTLEYSILEESTLDEKSHLCWARVSL